MQIYDYFISHATISATFLTIFLVNAVLLCKSERYKSLASYASDPDLGVTPQVLLLLLFGNLVLPVDKITDYKQDTNNYKWHCNQKDGLS